MNKEINNNDNDNIINNSCDEEKKIDLNINIIKEFDKSDKKNNSEIYENELDNYNNNIDHKSIDKLDKIKMKKRMHLSIKIIKEKEIIILCEKKMVIKSIRLQLNIQKNLKKIIKLGFYLFYYINKD